MAASIKPSSRYSSFDTRSSTSSHFSDPSSSAEFTSSAVAPSATSRALAKTKPSDLSRAKPPNLTTAMKNLMARNKSGGSSSKEMRLVIPIDAIAQDLKKTAKKPGIGLGLGGLPKKLFGTDKKKKEVKALTDVKVNSNARTLAMVLRSERELLSTNKEMEMEIAELKLMLEQKNKEVEKLKDLCLNQREEIKALKDAILFPDVTNSQLQGQLEKQGSELKQAKQIIPALQRQVTSLTGQLQCLADDLAEVKADRYSEKRGLRHHGSSSPRTPMYDDQEEADNSLEFSSEDATAPGSPDDLFLKDLNPCLTPHQNKSKSKEFKAMDYESPSEIDRYDKNNRSSHGRRMSRSSEPCMNSNVGSSIAQRGRRSDDSKRTYGKTTYNRLF